MRPEPHTELLDGRDLTTDERRRERVMAALRQQFRPEFLNRVDEILGARLATIHNLHYYLSLMGEVREAIAQGRFEAFRQRFAQDRARGVG